ncbi:DUF4362 domain-containing protein [Paenibacillus sp. LHD-117]|uniref:DUF4362 domain-containing protein n=1 Tax=Paenibacillus sp. LHD-117 TaxID=3071412 RepID=UPI0027DEB16F|nr:DUF4362 domain-containing protein [Paenibacillus sp. LHD-117]MDQ6423230.1 DUF4362 domain-containing protein [Paenibacillus sp. LHD-117]
MRRLLLIGMSIVLGMAIAGCGAGKQGEAAPTATNAAGTQGGDMQGNRVVVSRSLDFMRVNEKPYAAFEGKDEIAAFSKAVKSADKMEGQLDVSFPDYDVVIDQGGKRKEIHLWLDAGSDHGMFTYVSDTGTGYTLTKEATKALYELIWEVQYDSEQAKANGDVVGEPTGEYANAEEWETFVSNVEGGKHDDVQVVQYTIEGGPIFYNLNFAGDTIRFRYDNTHDAFGVPDKRVDFCESIEKAGTERGTEYKLAGCGGETDGLFELVLP